MRIGLIPGAYKPYTSGHDMLVRIAAEECDEVHLFVSVADRVRKGETPVYGDDMLRIWKKFIERTLQNNVVVSYVSVPLQDVYAELETAEANGDNEDVFVIYSDAEDIKRYSAKKLKELFPTLFSNKQVKRRGIARTETIEVSGTEMRSYLATGKEKKFISLLPPAVQKNGKQIFKILSRHVDESLLRDYVCSVING